jgi:hypothetical protein
MKLSDTEAEKRWPIYEQYVNELVKIDDANVGGGRRTRAREG